MKQKYIPESKTSPKLVSGQTGWVWNDGSIHIATINRVGNKNILVLLHIDSKTAVAVTIKPTMFVAKDS